MGICFSRIYCSSKAINKFQSNFKNHLEDEFRPLAKVICDCSDSQERQRYISVGYGSGHAEEWHVNPNYYSQENSTLKR